MSVSDAVRPGARPAVTEAPHAGGRVRVEWWLAIVVFGRLYTVLLCDVPERVFGVDWFRTTLIDRIPVYLWVELLLYGPIMWLALTRLNTAVFAELPLGGHARRTRQRQRFVGYAACAGFLYGVGIHAADIVEVYSREHAGIAEGDVYELVYYLDEGLSHYVQFVSLFFLLGWFVLWDRPGRSTIHRLVLVLGAAHGVERSLGVVEGEKWFLGPAMAAWLLVAAWVRWRRVGGGAADELFVRYAVVLAVTLPVGQALYFARYGAFTPPSSLSGRDYTQLAVGAVALTAVMTVLVLAAAHALRSHVPQGPPPSLLASPRGELGDDSKC